MYKVILTVGVLLSLPLAASAAKYEPQDISNFVSGEIHAPLYSNN